MKTRLIAILTTGMMLMSAAAFPPVQAADSAPVDMAETDLENGEIRVSIVDYDTGELITVSEGAGFALCEAVNEPDVIPIIAELDSNPCIIENMEYPIDEGIHLKTPGTYSIPTVEGSTLTDHEYYTVTEYDNGSADVVFRVKKFDMPEEGETRITLYERASVSDELIPSEWLEQNPWSFGTDIRIKKPDAAGGWMMTGPIISVNSNPCILKNDLASLYKRADIFEFICDYQPDVTYYSNGSMDLKFWVDGNLLKPKQTTTITFYDKDTGELADIPDKDANNYILKETLGGAPSIGVVYGFTTNPFTVDSLDVYGHYGYSVNMGDASGWYSEPDFEVISEEKDHIDLACKVRWIPSGDINGDEELTVADAVRLQKWLLGAPDTELVNWKAADYCRDNRIDVFDFCRMRQVLINQGIVVVRPEVELYPGTGGMFYIIGDDQNMYSGPGLDYPVIQTVPTREYFLEYLFEAGYNNGNEDWVFAEYNGKQGWIKVKCRDSDEPNIGFTSPDYEKPVIYLYPEEETDVHVELDLTTSDLATTYPKYNNGWDITAYPDGTLLNKADGTHHRYLFWDSTNCRTQFDFSKGFCVAGSDTESFLKEKLTYMGLTEEEMNEFIVYWLPRMEHNAYNLIAFQGNVYTDSAKLNITPTPDSLLRVFMTYVPLEKAVDIEPQQFETFERNGFTVVEWGGSEIRYKPEEKH